MGVICPSCSREILTAPSLGGVEIELQVPPPGWDHRTMGGFVIRAGHAEPTTKPKAGETLYVPHRSICRRSAA